MFRFQSETIYYNAFYAVQEYTNVLTDKYLSVFCKYLEEEIKDTVLEKNIPYSYKVSYDFDDENFLNSNENQFVDIDGNLIYYGENNITDDKLNIINTFLAFSDIKSSFGRARDKFHSYIKNLHDNNELITVDDILN